MNHAQIRAFHAVATEGSFTKAARALHVSQPAVTIQVKALEETFGVDLLNRRGQQVTLTELGISLLDVQWRTDHLASLGATEVSRSDYLGRLRIAIGSTSKTLSLRVTAPMEDR